MARIKKTSKVVEAAKVRLAGVKSIDEALDLGGGLTIANFETKIDKADDSLETYNTSLSTADANQIVFETDENDLQDFHERMLLAVGGKYGKDSIEYEKAGGTRKSERRKPAKPRNPPDE